MGAYLSQPVKDTYSSVYRNEKLDCGASSMQGWRNSQEDAHNCILDFDAETSLFGVYDGHGGAEVAVYASEKLPQFIKDNDDYKSGNYKEALISAFLNFDETLTTEEVKARLKTLRIAAKKKDLEVEARLKQMRRAEKKKDLEDSQNCSHSCENGEEDDQNCSHSSENGEEDDVDGEYNDMCDPETETPDLLRRDASRPLEEIIAFDGNASTSKLISGDRMKPTSSYLGKRRDGAGTSGECSSSFSGECSSSYSKSSSSYAHAGSSSTNEVISSSSTDVAEKPDANGRGDAKAESSSNGEVQESCSSAILKEKFQKATQSLKDEPSIGASANTSANSVNGDVTDEAEVVTKKAPKVCEKTNKESPLKPDEKPSCSSPVKKKKLALADLDNSDVVKNFITKEEISEDDEDDSEDETFQLDDGMENDSDDSDEEEDIGESLLSKLKRRLCQAALAAAAADDDDDDDDDDVPTSSEPDDDAEDEDDEADGEEDEDEEEEDEEEEEDDDDEVDLETINLIESSTYDDVYDDVGVQSGCTAVVALVKNNTLYVANAGDSRCVICKNGSAIDMSKDHKPCDSPENQRIIKAGGEVIDGRVNGVLNLSRALGDHHYKKNKDLPNTEQMITALPDVRVCELEPDVEFIVLACDGIWDSMTSQEVVDFMRPKIQANQKLSTICEELFNKCLRELKYLGGSDNMTCVIVKPLHGDGETCKKVEVEVKITPVCSSAEVDSTPSSVAEVTQSKLCETDNEAVSNAESTESKTKETDEVVSDSSLSSTSHKRCADSTEDDECQAKRHKTDQNDSS